MLRRVAANKIILNDKQLIQYVVEIEDGVVKKYYPLTDELPFTEWLGGTIVIKTDNNGITKAIKDGIILF